MNSILYFAFTNLIILIFLLKNKTNILLDKPDNIRKLHKENTPLLGGVIIIINIVILNIIYFTELNNLAFIFLCFSLSINEGKYSCIKLSGTSQKKLNVINYLLEYKNRFNYKYFIK